MSFLIGEYFPKKKNLLLHETTYHKHERNNFSAQKVGLQIRISEAIITTKTS